MTVGLFDNYGADLSG